MKAQGSLFPSVLLKFANSCYLKQRHTHTQRERRVFLDAPVDSIYLSALHLRRRFSEDNKYRWLKCIQFFFWAQ